MLHISSCFSDSRGRVKVLRNRSVRRDAGFWGSWPVNNLAKPGIDGTLTLFHSTFAHFSTPSRTGEIETQISGCEAVSDAASGALLYPLDSFSLRIRRSRMRVNICEKTVAQFSNRDNFRNSVASSGVPSFSATLGTPWTPCCNTSLTVKIPNCH